MEELREPNKRIQWFLPQGHRFVQIDFYLPDGLDDETLEDIRGTLGLHGTIHGENFMAEIARELGERHGLTA
jgi:hypothetical protein